MKPILYKSLGFLIIILISQILISRFIIGPVPEVALLDRFLREHQRVIYFGDSVPKTVQTHEADKSTVAEKIAKIDPAYSIADFSRGSDNTDMYAIYLHYISREAVRPQAVIIPINLRSFSPSWDLKPEYQAEKLKFFFSARPKIVTDFYRPLAILGALNLNEVPEEKFLQTPVYYGTTTVGLVRDFENKLKSATTTENIRDVYIYDYMYDLGEDHRKLRSLEDAIETAQAAGIAVYSYLTPIDYQNGERYVGKDFLPQTRKNAETVCHVLSEKGVTCFNWAFDLDSSNFIHGPFPDEHLNAQGRQFLAEHLHRSFFASSQ